MTTKVTMLNFVKESEAQHRAVDTEFSRIVMQVSDFLRKTSIPHGQELPLKFVGLKKYTRYQLQKRLQKAGHKIRVVAGRDADMLFVQNASE